MSLSLAETLKNTIYIDYTAAIAAVLFIIVYYVVRDWGLPPGPWGLPVLGYWPFIRKGPLHLELHELRKKYGEINSFRITGQLYIQLGTLKLIREAHVTKNEYFAGRNNDFTMVGQAFEEGVLFASGEQWKVLRKFFVQNFKEYGMSSIKNNMEGHIYDNLKSMVDDLRTKKGDVVDIIPLLMEKCHSNLRRMLFSDEGISKDELQETLEAFVDQAKVPFDQLFFVSGKIAKYFIVPFISGYSEVRRSEKRMESVLLNMIKRHESNFDDNNVRDMIDSYIKERKDRHRKNDPTARHFTDKALISSLGQFVGDGIASVAMYVAFLLKFLIIHPEEQDKIYDELTEVVGHDRQPIMEDRNKLPYTNAFILEVARTSDFFPVFPSLRCSKETTLNGYKIPKGAVTVFNMHTAHYDPETYENPGEFNPSRYISTPQKKKEELPILFGIGKRSCIGEAYTMMHAFLFLATLVKNFKFSLPDGVVLESRNDFLLLEKLEISVHPRFSQ